MSQTAGVFTVHGPPWTSKDTMDCWCWTTCIHCPMMFLQSTTAGPMPNPAPRAQHLHGRCCLSHKMMHTCSQERGSSSIYAFFQAWPLICVLDGTLELSAWSLKTILSGNELDDRELRNSNGRRLVEILSKNLLSKSKINWSVSIHNPMCAPKKAETKLSGRVQRTLECF